MVSPCQHADIPEVKFSVLPHRDAWLARFGEETPAFARLLLAAISSGDPGRLAEVRAGAEALGVLRAHQGHAAAGLVEDVLALRDKASDPAVTDLAVSVAVEAYVDELTSVLTSKATRDPLTGLPNRAAFEESLKHEIASTGRASAPSLLLVDLDKFKLVNDTDGHLAGDAVLTAVAEVLLANVRPSDLPCRLGGDEFAVVLPRTSAVRAGKVAERLLASSRRAAGLSSAQARVTLSIGIGWAERPRDVPHLVGLADGALYAVKASGGNGVRTGT